MQRSSWVVLLLKIDHDSAISIKRRCAALSVTPPASKGDRGLFFCAALCDDGGPNCILRRPNPAQMQHRKDTPFVASLYRRRPRIGPCRFGVPLKVENLNHAVPYCLAPEGFFDRDGFDVRCVAAVLGLQCRPQLLTYSGVIQPTPSPQRPPKLLGTHLKLGLVFT